MLLPALAPLSNLVFGCQAKTPRALQHRGILTSRPKGGCVPATAELLRTGGKPSDLRPIGTRHKELARVSRSSSRFTCASTNPVRLGRRIPKLPQPPSYSPATCRYPAEMPVRARHTHAFRSSSGADIGRGAQATADSIAVACAKFPRKSPLRSRSDTSRIKVIHQAIAAPRARRSPRYSSIS